MVRQTDRNRETPHRELIEPISIGTRTTAASYHLKKKHVLQACLALLALMLLFTLWFVVSAKTVLVEVMPAPETLQLRGKAIAVKLKDRFLAQPGKYQLIASKPGYYPLQESISIGLLKTYTLKRTLQKKPGIVSILAEHPEAARVYINKRYVGVTPILNLLLAPGTHSIELQRYRFLPLWTEVQIDGADKEQQFSFSMVSDWAPVTLNTEPENAQVWLDGILHGNTPLTAELDAGTHHLELVHPDFAAHITDFSVLPNQPLDLGTIKLDRAANHLLITSEPPDATVFINGSKRGVTPLTVTVLPNTNYTVRFTKPGYRDLSRKVRVTVGESKTLAVGLQGILGTVHLQVSPKTAQVLLDGKLLGHGNQIVSLTTTTHTFEVKETGYKPQTFSVVPRIDQPLHKSISLTLRKHGSTHFPAIISNSQGQQLRLIEPGPFTMGASRREQGRRANEVLRKVELKRKFYIGVKEVSNEEFARFDPAHNSGKFRGVDLTAPRQPVVNVSWQQAARYCNWLSQSEDLPVSYREREGKLVAEVPQLTGYRLVTEAEWAWVARRKADGNMLRYAWGDRYPPSSVNGNYADKQAKKIIGLTIPDTDDGFIGPAPIGSFSPNQNGLYDIAGNVAEWTHDFYTIYTAVQSLASVDPLGPDKGKHHVVRGASWLRGTLSNTRLSYRDYRDQPQADIGFRIARYAE